MLPRTKPFHYHPEANYTTYASSHRTSKKTCSQLPLRSQKRHGPASKHDDNDEEDEDCISLAHHTPGVQLILSSKCYRIPAPIFASVILSATPVEKMVAEQFPLVFATFVTAFSTTDLDGQQLLNQWSAMPQRSVSKNL